MGGNDRALPRASTLSIQVLAQPLLLKDEWGKYIKYEDAERLFDLVIKKYSNVTCRYFEYQTGNKGLLITSLRGKTKFLEVRVKT